MHRPGDKYLAARLRDQGTPVVAIVTKADLAAPGQVVAQLAAVSEPATGPTSCVSTAGSSSTC
jgi:hypothetical protein